MFSNFLYLKKLLRWTAKPNSDLYLQNVSNLYIIGFFTAVSACVEGTSFAYILPHTFFTWFFYSFVSDSFYCFREGEAKTKKEQECHTPEAVYKAKVVSCSQIAIMEVYNYILYVPFFCFRCAIFCWNSLRRKEITSKVTWLVSIICY